MARTGLLDIGEVRARTGLPVSTLHFYERSGLIESAARSGLRRQYDPEVLERLAVVVLCRRVGFRLDEIGSLLATGGGPEWKGLARSKLEEVRGRIRELDQVEQGLAHVLDCPSENLLRCEHFRAELDAVLPVSGPAPPSPPPGRPSGSRRDPR